MAKQRNKIRWRESDSLELQRAINNFNAKLYREHKKNPDTANYLPSRVKKSELVKGIKTRADLTRTINSLKRFSKRGAEKPVKSTRGAKATQWELDEFKRKQRTENARRTRERKKIEEKPVTSRGQKTGSKRSEMGSIKANSLKPNKANFNNLSQKEWELAKESIEKSITPLHQEFLKHNMRLNYIKGLQNAGFSDDIISLVYEMDIDDFIEVTQTDTEAEFDFIYDPIEFNLKNEALREVWENAVQQHKKGG